MNIQVAKRLSGTEEYYFSRKLREIEEMNRSGKSVINLGIGSPDLPPAPSVVERLQSEASNPKQHGYQNYKGHPTLRAAMSDWYKRIYDVDLDANSEILPLMGSKEGIVHICMTYLEEGAEALIPNPGYPTYAAAVKLSGAKAIPYALEAENGWLPDLDNLASQDLSRVKLMWINYPHMPTGARADKAFFEKLIDFGRKHNILICHDNPYSLILNDAPISLLAIEGAKEVALELNSLSKSANMAGWRVGMLCGNAERIAEVMRFKSNMDSGMFLPTQLAAAEALSLGSSWYEEVNTEYAERKIWAKRLLDLLDCTYSEDQSGLFVWAAVPTNRFENGFALSDYVLEKASVFITPGGIFGDGGNQYIRVSLCADVRTFQEATDRIKQALAKN